MVVVCNIVYGCKYRSTDNRRMIEVVQMFFCPRVHGCLFGASIRAEPQSLTLLGDWTTETSKVVLVFVRVRSGASAQLSGAY